MGRKKTHDQYVEEVMKINKDIEVVGQYQGVHVKITHRCKIDGYEWDPEPNSILHGHGCPQCKWKLQRRSHEEYVGKLSEIMPHIQVVGTYINEMTKILHKCSIHNYEWSVRPHQLLTGSNCPICIHNERTKTHEQYVQELKDVNPNIEVLGRYINNKTNILCKCRIHNYEFNPRPDSLLYGTGCPICNSSHGERDIINYLNEHNILFDFQYVFDDCKNILVLPFDFYLPKYNVCIEYDGEQHFRPVEFWGGDVGFAKRQRNDEIKNEFCMTNGIQLLRIRYDEDIAYVLNNFFKTIRD